MLGLSRFSNLIFGDIRRNYSIWTAVILLLWPLTNRGETAPPDPRHPAERKKLELWTATLPMQFEANAGQTDGNVKFLARGPGYQVFLTSTQAVLSLVTSTASKAEKLAARRGESQPVEAAAQRADLRMSLIGANRQPQIEGAERLPGIANYFIGNDPKQWHTSIPTFNKVKYEQVYPGIDLVYYGNRRQLEYDFIVGRGASPERIAFDLAGADRLEVDNQGNLLAHVGKSTLQWHKPFAYQELNGARQEVSARFVVNNGRVSFDVSQYDTSRSLVIDPYVVYSTYFGGNGDDFLGSITLDSGGDLYVIGDTSSLNFPIKNAYDGSRNGTNESVVVSKFSAGGSNLVFSTYIGGSTNDYSGGIALDPTGNIYITGQTYSSDFPMRNAAQATIAGLSDIFVAKLGPTGTNLLYSTYWGGPQDEAGMCITADSAGNAFVSGWTYSARNFPVTANRFQSKAGGYPQDNNRDAFVLKFKTTVSGASSMLLSSWLGGSTDETGYGIAIDSADNIYVAGIVDDGPYATFTSPPTSDFPVTAGAFQTQFDEGSTNVLAGFTDGFLTKVSSNGASMVFSTFIGGSDEDNCWGVVLDSNNRPYVVGETASQDFPITANALQPVIGGGDSPNVVPQDAFITEFQNTGSSLIYSTYLGGSSYESGFGEFRFGIALDRFGAIYVTGNTESDDFPLTIDADQTDSTAQSDAFIAKINPAVPGPNGLIYSTLLGGDGDVQFGNAVNYGLAIAVDTNGNFYIGGMTSATNFPFTPGAFSTNHNGGFYDMILAKFSSPPDLSVTMSPSIEPVVVGSNLTYSIQVNNNGFSTFHNVTNTLQLPPNVRIVAVSPGAGTWTTNSGALLFNIGTLTNYAAVTQSVTIAPLTVANLTAIATVAATEPDPNPLNNTVTNLSTVRGIANISVTNSAAPNPVLDTSNFTYTITVSNAGPWPATSLVVTDTLPAAVSFVSATTSQGISSTNGNLVTFYLGTLPTNSSATMTITVTTLTAGTFASTAGASFYELDPNTANNSATASVTITPLADLSLAMTQSANPSFVGATLTFTNSISNAGPSTASSVVLTNFLPPGMFFVSGHASQGSVSLTNGVVAASLGSISSNGTATVTVSVTNSNIGTFTNNGVVSSAATDLITNNNSASIATTVYGVADIRVTNSVAPNPILATSNTTYTITVSNAGPWPSTSLVVTDSLPAALQFLSATTSQGGWSTNGNTVTFTVGTLPVGSSATLTITAAALIDGTFNDTAGAFGNEFDPVPANNSATASLTVIPVADLSLATIPSLNPAYIGSTLVYTNFITNSGPSTATGVMLTNFLDPGVNFVSAQSSQGTVSQSNGIVTATLGTISSGTTAFVAITVTTPNLGTYTNNALVSSPVTDLNTNNNSASLVTAVYGIADISVAESVAPNPVFITSNLTYTITVSNAGPYTATSLVVTDNLPATVQFLSATTTQGAWSNNANAVTFTVGTLPTNSTATVTITATAVAAGTFTNTAGASQNEFDPVTTNNSASVAATVNPIADIRVANSVAPNPVFVGSNLTYTITVSNAGPSPATSLVVTDTLPAAVSFVSATGSQGTWSNNVNAVTFSLGTLPATNIATLTITATAVTVGTFTNTAGASLNEFDPVTTNNSASASVTIAQLAADLSLAMTQSLNAVNIGSTLVYTNTIRNAGPTTATSVVLTNFLPAGMTFVNAQSTQGSTSQSSGVVVASLGTLASNGIATVKITVTTPNAGTFTNSAVVASAVPDPVLTNNSASITTIVSTNADLSLAMTQSLNAVNVGSTLVYTNTVSNLGPSPATGVVLTNFLPAGVTFVSAQSSQGSSSQSSGIVVTTLGTIASNGTATVKITVTTPTAGTFTNNAVVASAVPDPVPANNSASITTTVNASADLSLVMTQSSNSVNVGSTLVYTNTVSNLGPSPATGVVLTNFLPAGVTFVSEQSSQGSFTQSNGVVVTTLGSIASNGLATVTITVTTPNAGTFTNNARVTSAVTDPVPANNSASITITVNPSADLSLAMTQSLNPVSVGSTLVYTNTVSNFGPSTATGVVLTNFLPAGVTFVSALPSQGSFTQSSGVVVATLGTIASNGIATLQITVTTPNTGTFTNNALVASAVTDTVPANNSASITTTVINTSADLSLAMTQSLNPVNVGSTLTYTNTVSNLGPSTATGVVLTNFLPAGVTFVSAQSSQGTFSQSNGIVSASLGNISSNGAATVTITVTTPNPGTFTNNALVSSAVTDPVPTNNSASVSTTVYGIANISVSNSVAPNSIFVSSNLTYSILVTNPGPWPATGLVVTDTLPRFVSFVSATTIQGTWSLNGNTVAFDLGALPANSSAVLTITATAATPRTFIDTATAYFNELDPLTATNSASGNASVTINALADLSLAMIPSLTPSFIGSTLVYTNFITNSGPSTATSAVLTNFLPAGVTFVNVQSSQGTASQGSGIVSASLGSISSNGFATVTITVTTTNLGMFTNNGIVSSAVTDPVITNNSDSVVTPVYGFADMSLTLSANTNSIMIRSNVTFTITVSNAGPYAATGVSLANGADISFIFSSVQPNQGLSKSAGGFSLNLGSMAIGSNLAVVATAQVFDDGTFTNTATISANESDPNPTNNSASVVINVADDPQIPLLRLNLAGTNAILSWTTNATGFVLQAASPYPTNAWTTNTSPPAIVGTRYTVTNPMAAPHSFYRLSR